MTPVKVLEEGKSGNSEELAMLCWERCL